jgi:hypothetical protein
MNRSFSGMGSVVPVILIALMFVAVSVFAFTLSSVDGERSIARYYGTHLVRAGGMCPTRFGPSFWFECDAASRTR